jgi:hypothetical protein
MKEKHSGGAAMSMSSFQTGTGLIDEYTLNIKDAVFAYDSRVQDGEVPILQLVGVNSETGNAEDSIWLKVGKNWEITDGGKSIAYTGTGKAMVNRQSQYGKFIDAFLAVDSANEIIEARGMDAFVAESWVGLALHVERVVKRIKINGQDVDMTEWVIHDVTGMNIPDAKPETDPDEAIPADTVAVLKSLAAANTTFEAFIDAAYEQVPSLVDSAYEDYVTDADGFYAKHKG